MHNKVGKFISSLRKEKGLTQKELADKLFVTDKAVSKWERGLSLPDITLFPKLADVLDVEVVELLEGQKGVTKKVNIEKQIAMITEQLKSNYAKKMIKISCLVVILILLVGYLLFRNIYLGYDEKVVKFVDRQISIGVPKASFSMKQNDRSYSYKTLRNANIVEKEQKEYLKTLKYLTCNDTIYYYDEKNDFSIIGYSVKNHGFYSTIFYQFYDYDYCYRKKIEEYSQKMNGLSRIHLMYGNKNQSKYLDIVFHDGLAYNNVHEFKAKLSIYYYEKDSRGGKEKTILEESNGTYEIRDDKLYYYRKEVEKSDDRIEIPEVSTFQLEDGKMILLDNYLSNYQDEIILE